MHLRSEDSKEWREDLRDLLPISLPSIPITSPESGKRVDIRLSERCLSSRTPERLYDANRCRVLYFRYREIRKFGQSYECFTAVTAVAEVRPFLSPVDSLVFHRHAVGFCRTSFLFCLCIRPPLHIFHGAGTFTSYYTEFCCILEHLFAVALSERTSTDGPSVS